MDASWSSENAFVSGAGGFRFKFQDGQIQRWSPQGHPWPEDTFSSPWFGLRLEAYKSLKMSYLRFEDGILF